MSNASLDALDAQDSELDLDKKRRVLRIDWLAKNGSKEEILNELTLFSSRIDELHDRNSGLLRLMETTYSRSMTAGRRQCRHCEGCKKYIPGSCSQCGCPPLLHEKLSVPHHQQELLELQKTFTMQQCLARCASDERATPLPSPAAELCLTNQSTETDDT
eukprot:NODE_5176_length_688_cov_40.534759_g5013_i0.p1 GENE.NODE_5176_length_688_cov_40.534759_g5013_i0~~NODE_5176_length_688_cov_40.534759_g5013_i0.p1  ORF type:complete len:160 (+),score=33.28 NODE_5176_length_688_cov_40.534759_g5013_i0:89-568(+)